ncbi:polyprotein [Penicillium sp. DV-2018c]|nr:polyprotein [Penicillium sp. DV-2018c]
MHLGRPSSRYVALQRVPGQWFINAIQEEQDVPMALMTIKERADMELSIKLRNEGVIPNPGLPFEQSRHKEIEGLTAKEVFDFIQYDPTKHAGDTGTPFEKSRLVIQAYNDEGKGMMLTQCPTSERASQCVIIALSVFG